MQTTWQQEPLLISELCQGISSQYQKKWMWKIIFSLRSLVYEHLAFCILPVIGERWWDPVSWSQDFLNDSAQEGSSGTTSERLLNQIHFGNIDLKSVIQTSGLGFFSSFKTVKSTVNTKKDIVWYLLNVYKYWLPFDDILLTYPRKMFWRTYLRKYSVAPYCPIG